MLETVIRTTGYFQAGSVPMWGTFILLLGWVTKTWLGSRRVTIAENKDDRDGFGALISALQADIVAIRANHTTEIAAVRATHDKEMTLMRADHRSCQDRLATIEGELMGYHRQMILQSQQMATNVPASGMVTDAGERAVDAVTRALDAKTT
jgi:hypothetical protein